MKVRLSSALMMLILGLAAAEARAGGVVIDFREIGMMAEDGPDTAAPLFRDDPQKDPLGSQVNPGREQTGPEEATSPTKEPEPELLVREAEARRQQQIELQRLIEAGVITPEEALVGCGATAATGPAGLAPLAIAAAALLRRRRRAAAGGRG